MRTAQCLCGQLRVRVNGEPVFVLTCSCASCQRRTGSVFGVTGFFNEEQVESMEGVPKVYTRTGDSGKTVDNHFCPECGTNLFWRPQVQPGKIGIAAGCFQGNDFPAPQLVAYVRDKHSWVTFPEDIPHFETARGYSS